MIQVRERHDNEVDDTARIQEAIDRAALAGDDIHFPRGEYRLDKPMTLLGVSHIIGDSATKVESQGRQS